MEKMMYKERECYLAADVAKKLGYKRVKDFNYRAKMWMADVGHPEEMKVVQEEDLKNLKNVKTGGQLEMNLGQRAKVATIFFIRGVFIICDRSRKPEADALFEEINRGHPGFVPPSKSPCLPGWTMPELDLASAPMMVAQQSLVPVARPVAQSAYLPLEPSVADQLVKIGVELADLSPAGEVLATDILRQTAERLLNHKLQTQDEYGPWKMPSVIASDNNVTTDAVSRAVSKLNLRGSIPGMCFPYIGMDTNSHSRDMYLYSRKATDKIIEVLNEYKRNPTRVAVPHPVATPPPKVGKIAPKVGKIAPRPYTRN